MRAWWLSLAILSALLAGCGQPSAAAPSEAPASVTATVPSSATATPVPTVLASATSAATQPVELFFTSDGKLAAVPSRVSASDPARQALDQLLKGPADSERSTEIPKTAHLQDVSIESGVATPSFDDAFFAPGGATGTLLRLAQVVFTLTQFPSVTSVRFLQNGQPAGVIGEGLSLNRAFTRQDFPNVRPAGGGAA